jgi:hypothetical protein
MLRSALGLRIQSVRITAILRKPLRRIFANWALSALVLLSVVIPALLTGLHSPKTSPVDEWVFIDYTSKVLSQGFVREGERVGEFTTNLMACEGVFTGGTFGKCDIGSSNPEELPYGGVNAAAAYTPLYFASTAILGIPARWLGVDTLSAWRLTGVVWLVGAMVFFVLTLRHFRVSQISMFSAGLLLLSSPLVWWSNTFVSTDAPSTFFGIAMLYFALRVLDGTGKKWPLALVMVVAVLFKVTSLVSLGFVGVYAFVLFCNSFLRRSSVELDASESRWRAAATLLTTLGAGVLSVALIVGWQLFISQNAIAGPPIDQGITVELDYLELARQVFSFLPGAASSTPFSGNGVDFLWAPLNLLLVAGVVGSWLSSAQIKAERILAGSLLLASMLMAPVLAFAIVVATGDYFAMPPRYGASLVPMYLVTLSFLLQSRLSNFFVISSGVFGVAGSFLLAINFA